MTHGERHPLITGTVVTSLGTLVSRVLGMLRDRATAALLGTGAVSDAFFFGFRIPNLFRRLFGEGALTASYLPVLTTQLDKDARTARQLASVVVSLLTLVLVVLVVLGEVVFGAYWLGWRLLWGTNPNVTLQVGLAAVMLPYLLLICIAAQLTTMLYASLRFTVPALTPAMLNVVMLLGAWGVAPWFFPDQEAQAYVLAVAVIVAGISQIVVQLPTLRRLGYRFDYNWPAAREGLKQIGRNLAPMLFGLAVTQINTFNDTLIARGLAASSSTPQPMSWLSSKVNYPMQQGAVTVLYYGERFYEVPVGIAGMSIAVAIFPLLSRHAARGDRRRLGDDMTLGLRLLVCLSVPAGIGLILLGKPIVELILQTGNFRPEDTIRTARVIACYASGVWAYCAAPVVVRGFYALNDAGTPARVAAWMVGLNLLLNFTLIWPMAEAGLALSTAIAAVVQLVVLTLIFSRRAPLGWRQLIATTARTLLATAAMAAAVCVAMQWTPAGERFTEKLMRVCVPIACGAAAYCGAYLLLGGRELGMLMTGRDDGLGS